MAFTPFEFVKLDPNALRSITVQTLTRKHGAAGAAVWMAVLVIASKRMDRTPHFEFSLADVGFDVYVEDDAVAAILTDWSTASQKRGDGFRFTIGPDGRCRIEWPEFYATYPEIFRRRILGDMRKDANGSGPEREEASGSEKKRTGSNGSRLDKRREEETREEKNNPPTPLAGGRADFDPDAPDSRYTGLHITAAAEVIPDLERIAGPLKGRERKSAQEQVALEIATLMQAGITNPQQRIRDALTKWPPNVPRSIGIVKQHLHGQVMARIEPPPGEDDSAARIRARWQQANAAAEAERAERESIIRAEQEGNA